MAKVIAQLRTMTGIRRTSSTDSANVIVEAYHNIAEGEVARVDFAISSNGGSSSTTQVASRQDWTPDDTDERDPLPGNFTASAPIPSCFGITINMSSYDAGYIDVTPTVVPTTGTSRALSTVRIYNDKDGVDRRPSTKVIYVSPSGNDSSSGLSTSTPVATINQALALCRQGGVSGGNVGGATVYLMEGTHNWGRNSTGTGNPAIYTEGHHWVTITRAPGLVRSQVKIVRNPDSGAWVTANGTAAGQFFRLRIKGVEVWGISLVTNTSTNIVCHQWVDGCKFTASVKSGEFAHVGNYGNSGGLITTNPYRAGDSRYATACHVENQMMGFSGFRMARGARIQDCLGVMFSVNESNEGYCNVEMHRVSQNNALGYLSQRTGAFDVSPIVISGYGNCMRVTARNSSIQDFGSICRELIGLQNFGIATSGFSNSANNGRFLVVGAGYSLGLSYVDLQNSSAVSETSSSSSIILARMSNGDPWTTTVHSDLHQVNGNNIENWIVSNVRCVNFIQGQGLSCNSRPTSNFAIVNIFDGYTPSEWASYQNSYINTNWVHGIMRNCTFNGTFQFDGNTFQSHLNSEITDCVFNNLGITGTNAQVQNGVSWRFNHYGTSVSNTRYIGTNTSTGSIFRSNKPGYFGDATVMGSSPAARSGGTTLWNRNSTFYEGDRGAFRNVAQGDWTLSPQVTTITQIRTVGAGTTRDDVVTCGVPFDPGQLWSEGQTITITGATDSPQRAQWYALPARHPDGSIKYARVSYRIESVPTPPSYKDATLRINGSYNPRTFDPSTSAAFNSAVIEFSVNGTILQIPLSSGTLIEGGGPEDHYARYQWKGRIPTIRNIWVEFTWDILSGMEHVKFWLRFGNSIIYRGYRNTGSPYSNTFRFQLTSPITLTIRNVGSTVYLKDYEIESYTSITNGTRYTIIDSGNWQANADKFVGGLSKSIKGSILTNQLSNTAAAESNWPTSTIALNWPGRVPSYFADNPRPAYVTTDQVGRDLIQNGNYIGARNTLVRHPYQTGPYSMTPDSSATGDNGWGGTLYWNLSMYHVFKSMWPVEIPIWEFSQRTLCFRMCWFYEEDLSPINYDNYPLLYLWYTSIHQNWGFVQESLGYYQPTQDNWLPRDPAGKEWRGLDEQHQQSSNDMLVALVTCDYLSMKIADFWTQIQAIKMSTVTPSDYMNIIIGGRDYARPMMTAAMLYEITRNKTLLESIRQRVYQLYGYMTGPRSGNDPSGRYGCAQDGLDKLKWVSGMGAANQVGDLPDGLPHTYIWQDGFVANALYEVYKVFKGYDSSTLRTIASYARKMSFDLAASCTLYGMHKFGPGSLYNWDAFQVRVAGNPSFGNTAEMLKWNLGTTVTGLTSGATGVIFKCERVEVVAQQTYNVLLFLKNVTGTFVSENVRNNSSGEVQAIQSFARGYYGMPAYYVNLYGSDTERQTPRTRAQLEENTPTPWDNDLIGALRYGLFYRAYSKWQQATASIALAGYLENYYTSTSTVTVSDLRTKAIDILLGSYNTTNTTQQYAGNLAVWDLGFWPFAMTIPNLAAQLVTSSISRTISVNPVVGVGSVPTLLRVYTTIVTDRTVTPATAGSTGSVPTVLTVSLTTVNITLRPQAIDQYNSVNSVRVTALIVSEITISAGAISDTSEIPVHTIFTEQITPPTVIINVILEMLLDGNTNDDPPPDNTAPSQITDEDGTSIIDIDSHSDMMSRMETVSQDDPSKDVS